MQQTEKYQLNLIETSDPFSPQALNENTQKVEAVLSTQLGAMSEQTTDLDARLKVVEVHKIATGSYRCQSGKMFVANLGFKPQCVVCAQLGTSMIHFLRTDDPASTERITGTGFQVGPGTSSNGFACYNYTYYYIAFA